MPTNPAEALLNWYTKHARDLPWRGQKDPYAVWVSEVMLQQTRVDTVLSYYDKWMTVFPNPHALANADLDEVLGVWEGLGYYRRAHNLHRAAKLVVEEFGGTLPQTLDELKRLPGIGMYTASAIAAFAYNAEIITLDGNLRRVLSRFFNYDQDPGTPAAEKALIEQALELMPSGESSNFNQALMDLGAMICIPRNPRCDSCPLSRDCLALAYGVQGDRPIRIKKEPIPHHKVAAGVLKREGKVLIARRPVGVLLGGLWEFPGGKCEEDETLEGCLVREWQEELKLSVLVGKTYGFFPHAYTHFRVTVHAFECLAVEGEPQILEHAEINWVRPEDLGEYPMGKVDREISRAILKQMGP